MRMATMTGIWTRAGTAAVCAALVYASALANASAQLASGQVGQTKASIELFTSQGCSSCPPADKLIGELSRDPALVTLSLAIDYWDYLGWKDTLASAGHSARQRAYARARGDRQVYTPQIVVNGATHVLGSDRTAVERAITATDRNAAIMSVPILISMGGSNLNVKVGAVEKAHAAGEVWLCPLAKSVRVEIGRGENHGRMITYHNVVRGWVKLGDWTGTESNWSMPLASIEATDIDAAAVMVQEGTHEKPGIILGAALAPVAAQTSGR